MGHFNRSLHFIAWAIENKEITATFYYLYLLYRDIKIISNFEKNLKKLINTQNGN